MAMIPGVQGAFDANEVDPSSTFEPLPAGKYNALIFASETKTTSKGDGQYLSLTFKITAPEEYAGRQVWCNLNLDNPSAKAVEIAQKQLSSICRATGVMNPEDSEELHGIEMVIRLKVRPETAQYPASNEISGFFPLDGEDGGNVPW